MVTRSKLAVRSRNHRSARQHPEASIANVLADFAAAYRMLDSGKLARYAGQHVAVFDGEVVGAGTESSSLRSRVSKIRGMSPERLAIIHVQGETTVYG
jgi:hypothetical protein